MEAMLLYKLIVTVTVVVALSLLAEHASPRLSGLLAGFPHGVAIILLFIGLEQGETFVAQAARFTLAGLAANALLAWAWALVLRHRSERRAPAAGPPPAGMRGHSLATALLAPLAGLLAFFAAAMVMRRLDPGPWLSAFLALAVIAAAARWMRRERDMRITAPLRPGPLLLMLRAALAALIVLLITALAGLLGPAWSGLLAGFPVVTFPFLLIVQMSYGPAATRAVLKAYPQGLPALVAFALVVALTIRPLGLWLSLLGGFAAALFWSALRQRLVRQIDSRRRRRESPGSARN